MARAVKTSGGNFYPANFTSFAENSGMTDLFENFIEKKLKADIKIHITMSDKWPTRDMGLKKINLESFEEIPQEPSTEASPNKSEVGFFG